jgi:hypothetical protein
MQNLPCSHANTNIFLWKKKNTATNISGPSTPSSPPSPPAPRSWRPGSRSSEPRTRD